MLQTRIKYRGERGKKMGEKAMKGKAITKVLSCLVVIVFLMSTFSVAVIATDSANSTASNVNLNLNLNLNDEANSSVESMRIMPSGNSDLSDASNTSSPGIINESDEVPDPDLPVINDTDIDTAKTISAMSSCSYVWIEITDKYCKGYKVYVDGVYQFIEGGAGGVLDGYCCFKVTSGYHTFKLTLNGKEVSKGWNCQCGHVYNWMSMNEMDPHWCEDGNDNNNQHEVKFRGEVTYDSNTLGAGTYIVTVDEVLYDPQDYFKWSGDAEVNWGIWNDGPYVENADVGDKVEVFGRYTKYDDGIHVVDLETSSHYLKKIDSGSLSIDVWTADASKNTKTEFEPGGNIYIWVKTNRPVTIDLIVDIYYDTGEHTQKYLRDDKRLSAANEYYNVWTAGEPGKRVLTLKAWDDHGNYAEDKWTFYVKGDQGDCSSVVNFKGTATADENKGIGYYGSYYCKVKVEELLSNPGNRLKVGNEYIVCYGNSPKSIKTGDKLEVYGEYYHTCGPLQWVGQIIAFDNDYYVKKISPESLSITVWTDKSEYEIGETVTIYYQTNKKCTAKLTITKPDGGKVVYGPNEIPACTRSKSPTAGYPTGKRTVVFEAWTGDEYKKATCYFDVVEEAKEVKFRGTVTGTSPEGLIGAIHWYVSVDEWISGSLPCDEIDVVIAMCPPFGSYDNSISKGDKVEVYGVVNPFGSDICTVGLNGESYYIKKIEEKWDVKFQGTVTGTEDPYIEDFICEASVDKIISGADYIEEGWTVNIILSAHDSPCGTYEEVKKGDKIEVFGQRLPVYCWPPQISLCGRSSYYLKKTEEKKANLIIQDIYWGPKDPKAGDKVTFAVTVKNQADRRINGEIDFYIDGEFKEGKGGETSAGYFSPGDAEVYHFDWTAKIGTHTIKFVTNPDDMLTGENGEDEKLIKFDICSEDEIKFIGTYLYSCVPLMSFHGYVFSIDEVLAGKNLTGKAIIVYADTGPKYKNELPFFVPTLLNLTKGDKVVIYARAETKWEESWDLKLPSDKYYIHKYRYHSAYINYLSGVGPFYGNYSNVILDPTFWLNLEKEKMEGVTESLMKDVGTTAVVTAITTLYPAATATLGKLSTITFPLTIVLILINEGERETYIAIGDAIYYADPGQLRVLLITLQNNGQYLKTVINEENSYSSAALELRQWTILSAYEELCSFDQRFLNNLRDTTITNKASQYNFAQKYIAMLANELIVDYALTTIELNDITGENEEVFLPKVSECELQSHCFQGIGGISNCFGYFNFKEDTDKYEITTSPGVSYLYIYPASPLSWHLKVSYILKQDGEEIAQGNNNGGLWVSSPSGIYELDVKSDEGAGSYGFDIYGVNIKPIK